MQVAGESMVGVGIYTLWTAGTGVVPLTAGALTLLAQGAACSPMDIGPSPGFSRVDGCKSIADGWGQLYIKGSWTDWTATAPLANDRICRIVSIAPEPTFNINTGWAYLCQFESNYVNGEGCTLGSPVLVKTNAASEQEARTAVFKLVPTTGVCGESDTPYGEMPEIPDYEYNDPETGCTLNYHFEGFAELSRGGEASPVFLVSGGDVQSVRSGKKVGGCNVYNYIAYKRDKVGPEVPIYGDPGGPGGPGNPPFPPQNDDDPFWIRALRDALGLFIIDQLLELFNLGQGEGPMAPAKQYQMIAPCDEISEGVPEVITALLPEQPIFDRILSMQEEQLAFLQQHLNWKHHVCDEKPELEGDWRTISFRSVSTSPYGKSCLRKRFRYRSLSGIGLGGVVDHWKNFTWQSGSVIVSHKGHSWGTPQVWAASENEGKRVIQHAAREAGFDAFETGEWVISSSSSSRYGVSASMKVDTTGGYYWITDRDGSNGRPIVAT